MDDLIYRQAVLEAIEHYYNDKKYITRSRTILSAICLDMKSTIDSLPSAQPEIIRCKDCRYYRRMIDQDDLCEYRLMQVFDDDFCSRAERRTDE